jgi:hypothetical protein
MITSEKLAIYRKYSGDIDGWARMAVQQDRAITGAEWTAITNLLQELSAYKRGLASERYGKQVRDKVKELAADDEVARQLLELA